MFSLVTEKIDLALIDGFVSLKDGKPGLGAYFFNALQQKIPVVGVAKTFFQGANDYLAIYRGKSTKPLYISALGIDLVSAAALVQGLEGSRIPAVLKRADQLSRLP